MRLLIALLSCLLTVSAHAAQLELPAALQSWRGWALDRQEFRDCSLEYGSRGQTAGDFVCLWPGTLDLRADAEGARFVAAWQLQAESWVPLPGDHAHWPQAVQINGKPAAVLDRGGRPQVWLPPGQHSLSGRLNWTRRPQSLPVPAIIGIIHLQVDGQAIVPTRHEQGQLILGRTASEAPEVDTLDVRVFRRLQDGVPITLETVIDVAVSGQAREALIGPVLPAGFVPTAVEVDAGWPARLEADGRLRVQLQPEVALITVRARALTDMTRFTLPVNEAPWPAQEIWSYQSQSDQRISSADGPPQVDPSQAGVPGDWQGLPAFAMAPQQTLTLQVRSRGLGDDAHNRLKLQRQAWLDYSGAGWTFHDRIQGDMRKDWRLDVQPPYRLEHANDRSEDEPLLVTRGSDGATGVEWRTPNVELDAGLRSEPASWRMPVHGWQQTFDAVVVDLHLPYGYRLIAAPGADHAEGSWVSRWTLLDLFLAALIGLLAWRSLGVAGVAVTALYVGLSYHEADAPLLTVATVLGLVLLARALPAGRLASAIHRVKWAAWAMLLLLALPFVSAQLRLALHPQLEALATRVDYSYAPQANYGPTVAATASEEFPAPPEEPPVVFDDPSPVDVESPPPAAPQAMQKLMAPSQAQQGVSLDRVEVTGARFRRADTMERYSQNTVVQSGRGVPAWQGNGSYRLSWSGPVTAEQSVRLWLSPPWLTRSLRVITVLALAWLLWRLAGGRLPVHLLKRTAATALVLMVAGLSVVSFPASAEDLPDNDLRNELQQRLSRPPECAPACVSIARGWVSMSDATLTISLEVHAGHRSAVPIPSAPEFLVLESLVIDGDESDWIGADQKGLRLSVERGVHRVELRYMALGDRIELVFPQAPLALEASGNDWQISGLSESRLLTNTLMLTRKQPRGNGVAAATMQEFPPYVRVQRTLTLGVEWTVETVVQRIAPAIGGFTVKLPLLPGEKVVSAGLQVREGQVELPIPEGVDSVRWQSNIGKREQLQLQAADLADHAEQWQIEVSPLWRVRFAGLPESMPVDEVGDDWHIFSFQPLPGETLTVDVKRPDPAAGGSQAIENVRIESNVGQRASEHTLRFTLRSSQGGERVVGLPDAAELLSVDRDGEALSVRLEAGQLSLPVSPGNQEFTVRFREGEGVRMVNTTPVITLGLPAANITVQQTLPDDRWVLRTQGPVVGPAVLYWGELVVVVLVAWALSWQRWTPLRRRDWLLLGLGFSTFSWWALLVVVVWLFALAWRERHGAALSGKYRFDAVQLALLVLTVIAAAALITAIPYGLLGQPEMHIVNPLDGYRPLQWFADQSGEQLPTAGSISLPLWTYRLLMLTWALWLANAVISWLRWGLSAWLTGGYWRQLRSARNKQAI